MSGMYWQPVECNPILQERGQQYAPPIQYAYGPYTATIPLILGTEQARHYAPAIPQAIPGGMHVTAQRNGQDLFIGDVNTQINYAAMKAPPIPTTGGTC